MKYFPLKTVLFCILLTPLFYSVILGGVEHYLGPVYQHRVENNIIGDSNAILAGTITIQDAVDNNIHRLLKTDFFVENFGIEVEVTVTVKGGNVLFPIFEPVEGGTNVEGGGRTDTEPWDSVTIARQNYEILNKGLDVRVNTRVRHGTVGANLILALLMMISLTVFFLFYRRGSLKAFKDDREKGLKIESFMADEKAFKQILSDLEKERRDLFENIKFLRNTLYEDQKKATITEDDLFEEIISLEKKLHENIELQQEKEREVAELKGKVEKTERRHGAPSRRKSFEFFKKRFAALYKNLDMNRRALAGFFELNDEMQIKAEEIIHQLNEDVTKIVVKRKVFLGKKNKMPSFEVLFGYNGRLYFGNTEGNRCEVLVIGTKNSQAKDMEFLHNL